LFSILGVKLNNCWLYLLLGFTRVCVLDSFKGHITLPWHCLYRVFPTWSWGVCSAVLWREDMYTTRSLHRDDHIRHHARQSKCAVHHFTIHYI